MKKIILAVVYGISLLFSASCQNSGMQEKMPFTSTEDRITAQACMSGPWRINYIFDGKCEKADAPIAEYVRRIFQDSKGQYWIGTNGEGIATKSGDELIYRTTEDGLAGNQITGITEDKNGNIWIATDGGVSVWDGTSFKNYTTKEGLNHNWTWSICCDKSGTIWVGTLEGLCKYENDKFIRIELPATKVKEPVSHLSIHRITSIFQDSKSNLWFGSDGCGIYKYDGSAIINLTTGDGLCGNDVTCIKEDKQGNMWFGTMSNGVCKFDGKQYTSINESNFIGNNEVWEIFSDKEGYVWFSSEGFGVYRYNGRTPENYSKAEGLEVGAVQTIYQDNKGWIWVGGGGGLYRFEGSGFIQVTRNGPWDGC